MSYKNLKLSRWTKGDLDRVYINTAYCDSRNGLLPAANGSWIYKGEDGMCRFGFKPLAQAEDRALGLETVAEMLCNSKELTLSWDELNTRLQACQTAGGNFSYVRYEKAYG